MSMDASLLYIVMMQFNTEVASITLSTFYFSILQIINISLNNDDINDDINALKSNNFTKNLCGGHLFFFFP